MGGVPRKPRTGRRKPKVEASGGIKTRPGRRKSKGEGGGEKPPPLKKARSTKGKAKAGRKVEAAKPRTRKGQKKAATRGAPSGGRVGRKEEKDGKKEVKGGKKEVTGGKNKVKAVSARATPGAKKGKRPARKRARPSEVKSVAEGEGKGANAEGKVKPAQKKRRPLGVVDRFPYNKRTVLFSSQSPLCFVQMPDIMDAGPALFQALGEEERAALASRLPAVDSCSEARLARCFQSPQFQQSARDFHKFRVNHEAARLRQRQKFSREQQRSRTANEPMPRAQLKPGGKAAKQRTPAAAKRSAGTRAPMSRRGFFRGRRLESDE